MPLLQPDWSVVSGHTILQSLVNGLLRERLSAWALFSEGGSFDPSLLVLPGTGGGASSPGTSQALVQLSMPARQTKSSDCRRPLLAALSIW